ncbi:MAG TPA: ATP-binding protein [Candidatus Krumholzibacteria bacterium]|nr:ATP-binding protein [Candidatus Krumholzibacteria bacterium]
MQTTTASPPKRLTRFLVFLAAFVGLLVMSNLALYRRARTHLDTQLGERLRAVATAVAHTVEDAYPGLLSAADIDSVLNRQLLLAREEQQLSNIVIISSDGVTAVDLAGYSAPGEENPFLDLDAAAVSLAQAGAPSYTALYRTGDVYLKSAYAPIRSRDGSVLGIVGVEAGATFFAQLRELRNLILLISLGTVGVVLLLAILFYRSSRSLDRAHEVMVEKENLATLGRMVATIAHEIRNPLSVIRGSAERVRRRHGIHDEALDYITDSVDELDHVLTGYLQFARSQPAEVASVSLAQVLRRALIAIENDAAAKHVEIRGHDDADVVILGDERRVRQAVLNVLLNALQAAPESGFVETSVRVEGDRALLAITDNGPGIGADIRASVTRPFFTTRVDGSGLGLTVVQSVMEEHAGELMIEPAGGGGTRVTLAFPIAHRIGNAPGHEE